MTEAKQKSFSRYPWWKFKHESEKSNGNRSKSLADQVFPFNNKAASGVVTE
jgi:hypothetical protein